jgi:hypothetical protein
MQPFYKQLRLSNHNTKLQKVMKRIIACLSLLITVMSCESDKFTYTPDELSGVFKPNVTADLSLSASCAYRPNATFGPSIRLEKISETDVKLISKTNIYDPNLQKNIESELSSNLTLKTHEDHVDLLYNGKVVGDYRMDKIYSSAFDNSKYSKGKILNIMIDEVAQKRFVIFRGVKE